MSVNRYFDVQQIRDLFPALQQTVHGKPLIYFDNAATTHKPRAVIGCAMDFYQGHNANTHRGMHELANTATQQLEQSRKCVQNFIHAPEVESVIFTSGTTEGLNLVASTYGEQVLQSGDEVLISDMEHHANIIPWRLLCQRKCAHLKSIPINHRGELVLDDLDQLITSKTKIVALCYVSNVLGTINPVKSIVDKAHQQGAVVVVDGAQAIAHVPVNVADLDCDFFAFSGHKAYGLTGFGCLYGKKQWLESMAPYQTGGGMVQRLGSQNIVFQDPPHRFEAGTLPLASIVAFQESLKFLDQIAFMGCYAYEKTLLDYALDRLKQMPQVQLLGQAQERIGIISFTVKGFHSLDIGLLLDAKGIAVRTGHCCAQPLLDKYGTEGVVRLSLACYNTIQEIDRFMDVLHHIVHR